MKTISALPFVLAVVSLSGVSLRADPQLSSWSTAYSAKYARIYTSDANQLAGVTATTWTNGSETQSLPSYTGVQLITYSDSWIYLTTSNLGAYTMGPWYNDAAHTTAFVNLPVNQHAVYRIPRTSTLPTPPATKSATSLGVIGYTVDGVSLFDPTDGYSYVNGADTMGSSGQWHRDAYVNEGITFDPGNSHQQNTGVYHNHADPLALRYMLGDHVTFNSSTKTYSESTGTPAQHSPILGWAADGYPIYGPYGYSSPLDATSGIRRMVGGFVKRDGATTGVDNINYTGAIRALPAWALRNNGNVSEAGPNVSSSYPFGRYCEDWAYLGDLIKSGTTYYQQGVDFDLNEYNVRYCVTPEFPSGTYAYFMSITSNGTPNFPYNLNRYFFGSPTGGAVAATETVTTYFDGGPNIQEVARMDNVASDTGNVTLSWSSVEGGTYKVEASPDLSTWSTLTSTQAAASDDVRTSYVEDGAATSADARFYRVTRTALASYDDGSSSGGSGSSGISSISPTSGTHGTSVPATITLNSAANPTPPPNYVLPTSVTLTRSGATTITATGVTRNGSTGVISATFPISAGATTGSYTVNAVFGPNTWSLTNGFTVN